MNPRPQDQKVRTSFAKSSMVSDCRPSRSLALPAPGFWKPAPCPILVWSQTAEWMKSRPVRRDPTGVKDVHPTEGRLVTAPCSCLLAGRDALEPAFGSTHRGRSPDQPQHMRVTRRKPSPVEVQNAGGAHWRDGLFAAVATIVSVIAATTLGPLSLFATPAGGDGRSRWPSDPDS